MLQFVTGDLMRDKKRALIQQLWTIKQEQPDAQLFYLVPEHLKFDMESFLLEEIQQLSQRSEAAMLDIQVVSFSRLAWFMQPASLAQVQPLSTVGLSMVVRQLLNEQAKQLVVYRGQVRHQGFVDQLVQLFEELYLGNVTPQDLSQTPAPNALEQRRLVELGNLYQAFLEKVATQSIQPFHALADFDAYLKEAVLDRPVYIVIDHHYFFNGQQLQLLMTMVQRFEHVWVTLPLTQQQAKGTAWEPMAELARYTYQRIRQLAGTLKLELAKDWDIEPSIPNYQSNMLTVATAFADNQQLTKAPLSAPITPEKTHIIWQNDAIQTEVRHVSNLIHQLVTLEGYRYRDILIVARQLDQYQPIVLPLFEQNQIPLFFDHERKMAQHPFVLWVEAALNLVRYRYQYRDLFYILKSNLWVPPQVRDVTGEGLADALAEFQHQVSILENVVLANGYVGFRFADLNYQWQYEQADFPYVNAKGEVTQQTWNDIVSDLRTVFIQEWAAFVQDWQTKEMSGEAAASWAFQLVDCLGVKQQLMARRDHAITLGELGVSRQYEQVWQTFCQTLDEFYQLYGQSQLSLETFSDILMMGLNESTFHIIPPSLDQVTFTSMESPQVAPYKICFVLGADEQQLPLQRKADSLLTLQNREALDSQLLPYQQLQHSASQRNSLELLMAQQLLLNATDRVYLSYVAMQGQQSVNLSPYFQQLVTQFHLPVTLYTQQLGVTGQVHLPIVEFGRYTAQLNPLMKLVRQYVEKKQFPSLNLLSFIRLMTEYDPQLWSTIERLFEFSPLPQKLSPLTAQKLFGKTLTASVSKIEQFYQDPYSHFLVYGLKLQEREQLNLSSARAGDYYHEFLDMFTSRYQNDQAWQQLFAQVQRELQANWHYNVFSMDQRMQLLQHSLNQRLRQFLQISLTQQAQLALQVKETEWVFGSKGNEGLHYRLPTGQLILRGKIDRIDMDARGQLLQVVDYKSGKKQFNLADFYYGLDLQVLTYLAVAMQRYPAARPVGAFYQSLAQTYHKVDQASLDALAASEHANFAFKNQMYQGLVTFEPAEMLHVDPRIETTGQSELYPVKIKRDGQYAASTAYADLTQYEQVQAYLDLLFKRAGQLIHEGEIRLAPYRDEPYTPSLQPAFRVISGFDATQHFGVYREKQVDAKHAFSAIQAALAEEVKLDDANYSD